MTAAETMQGILSTLDQKLRSFVINGALMDMLANSTFDIESIGSEKTAVFLITPDEKTSYHPLVAIFISQSYQHQGLFTWLLLEEVMETLALMVTIDGA